MKVLIVGCGRVGCSIAVALDKAGHDVTMLDNDQSSLQKLPSDFKGNLILGNCLEKTDLIKADIESTDAFIALTQGDNRNIMTSEIAKHIFGVKNVLCRIYDPIRCEIFNSLGIKAFSPTTTFSNLFMDSLFDNIDTPENVKLDEGVD